ncbi:MAG: hypothetical protein HKM87_07645 [Ignavibacteriaceae bacterium]|nr:hypothetical protein [Ignavibacteriaceae bacterium]
MEQNLSYKRKDYEPPLSINKWGWRFHHIGIPTNKQLPNEKYIKGLKMFVTGFDTSPYGIEWMRFENNSPISVLVQTVPHIAFEVDDIEKALEGKEVLTAANTISEGIKVAMIIDNGAPIELLEFGK